MVERLWHSNGTERWAVMPDGRPAWQVAMELPGMTERMFRLRLRRPGWSPERAATQPLLRHYRTKKREAAEAGVREKISLKDG